MKESSSGKTLTPNNGDKEAYGSLHQTLKRNKHLTANPTCSCIPRHTDNINLQIERGSINHSKSSFPAETAPENDLSTPRHRHFSNVPNHPSNNILKKKFDDEIHYLIRKQTKSLI
jgi:hypothetical protein